MPVYHLNMHNKNITNCGVITTNDISGNYNQGIDFDSSSNIVFNRNNSVIATLGSKTIASTIRTGLDVSGAYYSNSVSAIQIPADTSDNRPSTGVAGYIRYNTNTNLIEYWNNGTNTWTPVSEPSPSISTISPQYVLQDISSTVYTITGANFNIFSSVSFIGTDGITYPTASTTYVTGSQLTTLITDAIADASTNTYAVKVTNTNTNFSATTAFIVTFNKGPFWNTAVGSSLGIGIAGVAYTTGTSPFTDLSASEFAPVHLPITYYYSTAPSTVTGSVLLDASLGRLYGTMPSLVTGSTLYNFTAYPQDASGARGFTESFNFTVQSALLTVTGYTLNTNYTITYVDSSNNLSGSPSVTGYTIYRFTGTGINGTVTPNFDASINYLVAGGGGGGGSGSAGGYYGGGGGAGGYRAGEFRFVRNTSYDVIVGAGGVYTNTTSTSGTNGGSSRLGVVGASGITSSGGGGGPGVGSQTSNSGGSGSGGAYIPPNSGSAGASGNSGGYTPVEGFAGGGYNFGGQGAPGGSALEKGNETTANGSLGAINNITGVDVSYCSGGWGNPVGQIIRNGTGNGGAAGNPGTGLQGTNGSSGVVIVRFPSLITYNPSFKGGRVTGFYPGQYTITYVTSGNSLTTAPVSGGFTIYTFLATTTGTFVPNFTDSSVDFLVIGGGGAGGNGGSDQVGAGGGGAGGYRTSYSTSGGSPGTPESKLSLTSGTSYTVTVGAGGDGRNNSQGTGNNGANSVFSSITSVGGGGGGSTGGAGTNGATGGSGGGANAYANSGVNGAGTGTPNQGFAGFQTTNTSLSGGGGGGGASGIGGNSSGPTTLSIGGAGGTGLTSAITGVSVARGGGGGGGAYSTSTSASGGSATSGGGSGASSSSGSNIPGSPGTQNTGGGGGGAAGGGGAPSTINKGGSGGSGIVVIRFSSF